MDMKLFNNNRLVKVVSGNNHTVVLAGESVYAWGNSESGQTGLNPKSKKKKNEFLPTKFASKHVVDIFSGSNHSFLISEKDGKRTLKAWGLNNWGQLGLGDRNNFWYPMVIDYFQENNIEIKSVTGGEYHTLFLDRDNQLYACGKNDEGQCGIELKSKENPADNSNHTEQVEIPCAIGNSNNENENIPPKEALEIDDIHDEQGNSAENENRDNLQATSDVNQSEWVFTTPVKLEFFNKQNVAISHIYSSMGYNYALDVNDNQAYSWGDGNNYKLGNKKESEVKLPFCIPKVFFSNLKLDHVINSIIKYNLS
jgi:alpha-tubulin suppressor-like RCC1 family protein